MNRPSEFELHAFVDGLLDPQRAAQVEAWLRENDGDAAMVGAWQAQKEMLRQAYGGSASGPEPDVLRQRLLTTGRQRQGLPRLAAALAWIALGGLLGFLARGVVPAAPADDLAALPRHAAIAHVVYTPEVRHPVEVGADQEAHLVQWLSKRLGGTLSAPDLGAAGFRLMGGRLLPSPDGPAAQFMYEDKGGQRLTLYVRSNPREVETAFRYADQDRVGVFYWIDGGYGYALSGALERDALLRVARLAYPQLGGR
ncbi:anti-sigma factor family protein [Noviherbaspirillum aridicola]|uniref:Membrane protein n=1 Tax=Noviherbaspirillum aridicola TaxID=2849687 RepID=A0ABQ4PZM6_9BURK|nr:anti-sigma factor [Noviherbaspirillum aridicola]GIZ50352.1 membrane protein [Noviherbaspirillum aridicola]